MPRSCHRKYHETGLWYEIKCIEETIEIKKQLGKDARFEKSLLRAFKKEQTKRQNNGRGSTLE